MRGVAARITILILTIGMAPALAKESSPFGQALTTLLVKGTNYQPLQQSDRANVSRNIAEFCRQSADAIPTLSPRENDWLNIELDSPRVMAALVTIEYSKRHVSKLSTNCLNYTGKLLQILKIDTKSARRSEALLWGLLAGQMLDTDFYWHVDNLKRNGVVHFAKEDMQEIEMSPTLGLNIIESILIPHLMNEAQ